MRCGGENVSAYEVESAARAHPAVHDCAAYPVPSRLAGDEVMLAVRVRAGVALEATALGAFLAARLPRRARPRYLRFVDALPRTSTQKLDRKPLVAAGITTDSVRLSRSELATCPAPRGSG